MGSILAILWHFIEPMILIGKFNIHIPFAYLKSLALSFFNIRINSLLGMQPMEKTSRFRGGNSEREAHIDYG